MLSSRSFDVDAALAPARRALGLAACATCALRGLTCGAAAGAALLALNHLHRVPGSTVLAVAALVLGALAGLTIAVVRWPDRNQAARAVDRHFLLGDRLTTALEFKQSREPLLVLQRSDAAHAVRGLPLYRTGRGRGHRKERALALVALGALACLALVGGSPPPPAAGGTPGFDEQRIRHAGQGGMQAITSAMDRGLSDADRQDPAAKRLRAELNSLQRRLLQASSLNQALRAISLTQQQLRRQEAQLHPLSNVAIAQLNRSLGRYLSRQGTSTGSHAPHDAGSMARSLARLASSLQRLREAQRRQLAHALMQAAKKTPDARLRNPLRQAAGALGRKDSASAAIFLKHGVTILAHSTRSRALKASLRKAGTRLDRLKNSLSAIHHKQQVRPIPTITRQASGPNAGKQGKGASDNGKASRRKRSTSRATAKGWKPASEKNAVSDRKGITPVRRAGEGGRVNDDPKYKTEKHRKARATVYLHGHEGTGARLLQNGPSGAPGQRAQARYRQLVVRYARTARAALERGVLPPDMQTYVRRYFSKISR